MKKTFFALFILFPVVAFAQLQVIGGLGFLFVHQQGILFLPSTYDPNFLLKTDVDRKLHTFGETVTAFYRCNIFSSVPSRISIGPQAGFGFYYTRLKKSTDPNYQPAADASVFKSTSGPFHVPLEFAIHFGSLSNPDDYEVGMSLSGGVDMLYLHVADEKAFTLLPCGSIILMFNKTGVRYGFHFMKFQSVYNSNQGQINRLTNALSSFELVRIF